MKPPYSLIRKVGNTYYLAGHIPVDSVTKLVAGDVATQTKDCLNAISATLETAGLGLDDIVKTTVFLKNIDDFTAMNEEYARHFTEPYPTRSTVEVACLPKMAANGPLLVEIEAIACKET